MAHDAATTTAGDADGVLPVDIELELTPLEAGRPRLPPWLTSPTAWTWIGIVGAGLGFVLIALAWGGVARETLVYRQLPYIASAGFGGLTLVVIAVAIISMAARERDRASRRKQVDQLVDVLTELRAALDHDAEASG